MKNPVSHGLGARLAKLAKDDLVFPNVVTIPLRPGECREERADDLREWCAANCTGGWKPRERWTAEGVRIAFACASDAVEFYLSV